VRTVLIIDYRKGRANRIADACNLAWRYGDPRLTTVWWDAVARTEASASHYDEARERGELRGRPSGLLLVCVHANPNQLFYADFSAECIRDSIPVLEYRAEPGTGDVSENGLTYSFPKKVAVGDEFHFAEFFTAWCERNWDPLKVGECWHYLLGGPTSTLMTLDVLLQGYLHSIVGPGENLAHESDTQRRWFDPCRPDITGRSWDQLELACPRLQDTDRFKNLKGVWELLRTIFANDQPRMSWQQQDIEGLFRSAHSECVIFLEEERRKEEGAFSCIREKAELEFSFSEMSGTYKSIHAWLRKQRFCITQERQVTRRYTYFDTRDRALFASEVSYRRVAGEKGPWFRYDLKFPPSPDGKRVELSQEEVREPCEAFRLFVDYLAARPCSRPAILRVGAQPELRELVDFTGRHDKCIVKRGELAVGMSADHIRLPSGELIATIELELQQGDEAEFKQVVDEVTAACNLSRESETKLRKALRLA